jgi:AraC-like DNA-binding protein
VDAVAGLLDGPRAREAFVLRTSMNPPWSLRIADQAPLTLVALARGHTWALPDGDVPPCLLQTGDVAIFRGPDAYTLADDPATPVQAIIHPGQRCTTLSGEELAEQWSLGVRSWGNAPAGSTVMLTGTYQLHSDVSQRLLRALPSMLLLRASELDSPLVPLLAAEIGKAEPGQEAVLDRLLDLLLIAVLRSWFARPDGQAPGWYRAHADPVVGHALRLMHHNPAHPWTLAELAHEVGISRPALARRFHELVGEPPMTFLTGWRITLAADLLREPGATLAAVAHQVGYGSPFALSSAFKRLRGVSPQQYRALNPAA